MFNKNKPMTGYPKKKPKKDHKERKYLSNLVTPFSKKIAIGERILKFIIYITLRIVVKPSRWKKPEKTLEIINRTYQKIVSSDFVFIPSSIAYHLLMAFIPLIMMISLLSKISFLQGEEIAENLQIVFNGFIPGFDNIWKSLSAMEFSTGTFIGIATLIISSLWISSTGFSRLIYTQSHLYDYKYVGGYWMNKLRGTIIVILFSTMLFFVLLINFFFVRAIRTTSLSSYYQNVVIKIFLYVGLIILVLISYLALFKLSPRYQIKIRHIIPGTMVATIPTIIFIVLLGLVGQYLSYKKFGYIGTFLYVGLLVIEISYFMIVGLIVNVSYYKTFVGHEVKKKKTIL